MFDKRLIEDYIQQFTSNYEIKISPKNYLEIILCSDGKTGKTPYSFTISLILNDLAKDRDNTKLIFDALRSVVIPVISAGLDFKRDSRVREFAEKFHVNSSLTVKDIAEGTYYYNLHMYRKRDNKLCYMFRVWSEGNNRFVMYHITPSLIRTRKLNLLLDITRILTAYSVLGGVTNTPRFGEEIFFEAYKNVAEEVNYKNLHLNHVKTIFNLKLIPVLISEIMDKRSSLTVSKSGFKIYLYPDGTVTFKDLYGFSKTLGLGFTGEEKKIKLSWLLNLPNILS